MAGTFATPSTVLVLRPIYSLLFLFQRQGIAGLNVLEIPLGCPGRVWLRRKDWCGGQIGFKSLQEGFLGPLFALHVLCIDGIHAVFHLALAMNQAIKAREVIGLG